MLVKGAVPFNSFKEKLAEIARIKSEFNNKVTIQIDDDLILYTHIAKERDGTIVI